MLTTRTTFYKMNTFHTVNWVGSGSLNWVESPCHFKCINISVTKFDSKLLIIVTQHSTISKSGYCIRLTLLSSLMSIVYKHCVQTAHYFVYNPWHFICLYTSILGCTNLYILYTFPDVLSHLHLLSFYGKHLIQATF